MKVSGNPFFATFVLLASCGDERPSRESENHTEHSFTDSGILAIETTRAEANRQLFNDESEAQRHEVAFVRLWDAMRLGEPFAALANFSFKSLSFPQARDPQQLSFGPYPVQSIIFAGPTDVLTPEIAQKILASAKAAGWRIVQSEWHHDSFAPTKVEAQARSVVSFEVHAEHAGHSKRIILKGKLEVSWSGRDDGAGVPVPDRIEVKEMENLQAAGPTPFREIAVIDPVKFGRPASCSPLLAQDLDGDGLSELIVVGSNLLFRNRGGGRFDREDFLAVPYYAPSDAGVLADFTGDGNLDFVGASERDLRLLLFEGDAKNRFTRAGRHCFPGKLFHPQVLTAGDVDGDGDLDLYLGQYRAPYLDGSMPTPFHDANDGHPDFLLLNDGSGGFRDGTDAGGLAAKRNRRTYAASLVDLDEDGDLDLAVTADFAGLDLYANAGDGRFLNVAEEWAQQRRGFGMSHVFGDVNGDGRQDLYFVGMSSTTARRLDRLGIVREGFVEYSSMRAPMTFGNRLLLGLPGGGFRQPAVAAKIARTGWSWGSAAEDFDNDGDLDLFVANGHLSGKSARDYCTTYWCHDVYEGNSTANAILKTFFNRSFEGSIGHAISWNGFEHNALFLNKGAGEDFLGAGFLLGVAGEFDSRAVLPDDQDGDGRVDLLVVEYDTKTFGQRIHIYRNERPDAGNWIGIHPRGTAIGAKVTVKAGDRTWTRCLVTGESFAAQKANVVRFGLGDLKKAEY
ncbi:MAG: CRTAC1 family protein, partial [Opitutales bacterium]